MTDEQQQETEAQMDRRRWHFKRELSWGDVLMTLVVGGSVFGWGSSILSEQRTSNATFDKRISILEERSAMQKQIDAAQDALTRDGQQRIEAQLGEIQRYLRDPMRPK